MAAGGFDLWLGAVPAGPAGRRRKRRPRRGLIADTDGDTVYTLARLAIDRGHKVEAKRMVQNVLKINRSFMLRPDVEELLEQLNKPAAKGAKP